LKLTEFFSVFSVLSGYVVEPDRRLYPITWSDLRLWQHGENGEIPDIIQFNVASGAWKYLWQSLFCDFEATCPVVSVWRCLDL